MSDYSWTINGADYDVEADFARGELIQPQRGDERTFEFELVRGGVGADIQTRYDRLVQYIEFADNASAGVDVEQVPWYREHVPSRSPVTSHLIEIVPGADVDGATGVWGLVVGGDVTSTLIADSAVVRLEVFILADSSRYADRTAVQNDLERPP